MDFRVGVAVFDDGASWMACTIEDIPTTDIENIEIDVVSGGTK